MSNTIPPLPVHYIPRAETDRVLEVLRRGSRLRGRRAKGPSIVVVTGRPGVGKTSLAIACARELGADFTTVRWVRAHSREALAEDLVSLAVAVDVIRPGESISADSLLSDVYAYFARNPDVLLILDGATVETLAFVDQLPLMANSYNSMLVTCSGQPGTMAMPHERLELEDFTWGEAMEYVTLSLGAPGRFWVRDSELAELVEVTGTNPGALAHAVTAIETKDMSVRFRVMRELASSEGFGRIERSLVWITREGQFIGTGVVVGTGAVLTGVPVLSPGALRVHRLHGRGLDVTRVRQLNAPEVSLLSVPEELPQEVVAAVADDFSPFAAVWFRDPGGLGTPGLQVRSVSRRLNDGVPGAVVVDEDGRLCSLVRETADGGLAAMRIPPALLDLPATRAPLFYLSYAHTPSGESRDHDLERRFFSDLSANILQLTNLGSSDVGFIDVDIPPGTDWRATMMRALAEAQVLVPLYSPSYFKSKWCGREWAVFNWRMELESSSGRSPLSAIVPVIWLPTDGGQLPSAVRNIQYGDAALGNVYFEEGLLGLLKSGRRREYREAVFRIAVSVVEASQSVQLRPCDPNDLPELRNAFEDLQP